MLRDTVIGAIVRGAYQPAPAGPKRLSPDAQAAHTARIAELRKSLKADILATSALPAPTNEAFYDIAKDLAGARFRSENYEGNQEQLLAEEFFKLVDAVLAGIDAPKPPPPPPLPLQDATHLYVLRNLVGQLEEALQKNALQDAMAVLRELQSTAISFLTIKAMEFARYAASADSKPPVPTL